MFGRFKIKRQRRRLTRQDRQNLEARVRRFLNRYLSASEADKDRYYDVVADVAAGCHPENVILYSENLRVAEMTAETASGVVERRIELEKANPDPRTGAFILDAYATVAVAYRRAAGIYAGDEHMQSLGTAAVHLLTMATSRRMAKSTDESPEASSPPPQQSVQSATEPSYKNG